MRITLTPIRRNQTLTLVKTADTLTVNGELFDFSGIPEGATLPQEAIACEWLASDIERVGGQLHLALILPHGANAPPETLFPVPITLETDGPVLLPPYESPAEETPE